MSTMTNITELQLLLQRKAELNSRLVLLPYDGTPEIKTNDSGKYLYVRKRFGSKITSTYVGIYSDELYQLLVKNNKEARELRKQIRHLDKELAEKGYVNNELPGNVILNLEFARANMNTNIYDQAVLEGVATSFPQTEEIIENGMVSGMSATDVQKILNLKHAWEFILDNDVIQSESTVKETIQNILYSGKPDIDIALNLCLYSMKTQVFIDGNKRASVIFANHYLIAHGGGLLVIPENDVPEFKKLLVSYYEGEDPDRIMTFLKNNCWKTIQEK